MDRKILAVVPARGGSKGIKLKNLREVRGVSLIGYVADVIQNLPEIHTSIISSDHADIISEAMKFGLEAPFIRPKVLSGDRISDIDVLTHALHEIERFKGQKFDIILMLQPTSPFRTTVDVRKTLSKLIEGDYDSVFTISETDSKGHPLKQFNLNGNDISYYENAGSAIIARQELKSVFHKNGLVYALTRQCLIEQKTLLGVKSSYVLTKRPVVNIDTEFDLILADFLMS